MHVECILANAYCTMKATTLIILGRTLNQVLPPKISTLKRQEGVRICREHGGSNKDRRATTSNNKTSTLQNTFNGKVATGDQRQHITLLTFYDVGQREYECYVTHTFICACTYNSIDIIGQSITYDHRI